jgi:hypothetical protein
VHGRVQEKSIHQGEIDTPDEMANNVLVLACGSSYARLMLVSVLHVWATIRGISQLVSNSLTVLVMLVGAHFASSGVLDCFVRAHACSFAGSDVPLLPICMLNGLYLVSELKCKSSLQRTRNHV